VSGEKAAPRPQPEHRHVTQAKLGHNTPAMSGPLYNLLPPTDDFNSDDLLGRFLEYVTGKGLTLYPAQEE